MLDIINDSPGNHGLSSGALQEFFRQVEQAGLNLNSFILLQDGKATARYWREPYRRASSQVLFSLSKSVTSIAVGIAWDSGLLDLHDPVISFFPDKLPETVSSNLEKMTVHHLLSMNTGHHENIYGLVAPSQDWVRTFLSLEVLHEPGSQYLYNTHATYMLSAILERVTGQSLVDFLMPRLFGPLKIPRPSWETCPGGITAGGMGLSLSTESIAKFGQMLLGKGMCNGRRIVSEAYLELATREQSDNRGSSAGYTDVAQGYGYQFHRCRRGAFRGDGAFGQLCLVVPDANIVIAATSSFTGKQLHLLLDLIFDRIIDQVNRCGNPAEQAAGSDGQPFLMTVPFPAPASVSHDSFFLNGRFCYRLESNPHNLAKLCLRIMGDRVEADFHYENAGCGTNKLLPFHLKEPVYTEDVYVKDLSLHLQQAVTYAAWQDRRTLKLTLVYIETPYMVTYTLGFGEETLQLQFRINVSFSPVKEFLVKGSRMME